MQLRKDLAATLAASLAAPRGSRVFSRLIFLSGLIIWLGVQGALVNIPLWSRNLPPNLKDSLTYVLKTKRLEEGAFQITPALEDLKQQLHMPSPDPAVSRQQALAGSRVFPFYHPLFSLMISGLSTLGFDLMTSFKLVWSVGPLIFGVAFASLLATLFGTSVAGIALSLLAFKVFPDTGLHYVVPSNLAMALAVFLWARLISCGGHAPWTLALGSLALLAMHPIGGIYVIISAAVALLVSAGEQRKRAAAVAMLVSLGVAAVFILLAVLKLPFIPNLLIMPGGPFSFPAMFHGVALSGQQVACNIIKLGGGLFGSLPIFCAAVTLGLLSLPGAARRIVLKLLGIQGFFLLMSLAYLSSHPADLFLRLWIPAVVVLFGLVGQSLVLAVQLSWPLLHNHPEPGPEEQQPLWPAFWPLVLAAFLAGYSLQMVVKGAEIVYATANHMQTSQPLDFTPEQPRLLLAQAQPGDRVLYTSLIIMPYYLIYGADRLGAVYYHPAFQGTALATEWLSRPDLRYAVIYNPLMYHPSFQGVDETRWWTTSPDFYFSPLNKPRIYSPLAKDGKIDAADYRWLEIAIKTRESPRVLNIQVTNRGGGSFMKMIPVDPARHVLTQDKITAPIPAKWSGKISLNLGAFAPLARYRLVFPDSNSRFAIRGINFGDDQLCWPWEQKASIILMPREGMPGEIAVSFDVANLLPAPLNTLKVSVLNDQGSSVLLKIHH